MEDQTTVEKCFNPGCSKFDKTSVNGCSRNWEEGDVSISAACEDFVSEAVSEAVMVCEEKVIADDGSHKCDSCALDFATCGSISVKFGIDLYPDAVGKEDRVISCGSYAEYVQAEQAVFVCDETSDTFTRTLPVPLSPEELSVMGAEMARLINIWTKAKLDKQAFDKSMKALIDSTEEDYIQIAAKAATGAEERPVACYWQMDRQHGLKRLYRCDTGEMVEETNMELLDYKHDPVAENLEDSIANVQNMAQGQASDSQDGECIEVDTDIAAEDESSSEDDSDGEWPDPPERK